MLLGIKMGNTVSCIRNFYFCNLKYFNHYFVNLNSKKTLQFAISFINKSKLFCPLNSKLGKLKQ